MKIRKRKGEGEGVNGRRGEQQGEREREGGMERGRLNGAGRGKRKEWIREKG
jgi:hypothetical protein